DFETTGVAINNFSSRTYPIELGYILTDDHLNIIDSKDILIRWDWMNDFDNWPLDMQDAYKIHRIELADVKMNGKNIESVVGYISNSLKKAKTDLRPTIISDNAYFETYNLHKIYNHSKKKFPFHYTSWDINILCKSTNVEKTKEHSHRALDDAADMYTRVVRSLEKIGYFDTLRKR
ncbi:MAG: hypothetical protein ACOC22_03900, partial [bacterium]